VSLGRGALERGNGCCGKRTATVIVRHEQNPFESRRLILATKITPS
jgi:hypothetical protein